MGTSSLLVGIVFYSLALLHEGCAQADDTLVAGASGSDVVAAVIARIEASGVFPTDNRLLRRIAYVESLDGMHPNTYRTGYYGGIWQVDMIGFEDTQNTASHPGLAAKHEAIERYFGSDFRWSNVKWEDLVKPLYSGIAARLFLSNKPEAIPPASDISGQAAYWKNFYNTDSGAGTEQSFIDAVNMLEQQEVCKVKFDLIFVLDSSGSVGSDNYDEVRTFVHTFVSALEIGAKENQVGVIIFGDLPETIFHLNQYWNKEELLQAINGIPYIGGFTNTGDALRLMISEGFTEQSGARLDDDTIFRLAVVMTDGKSNRGEPVLTAAPAVHAFRPPILVYVIGVTDSVNVAELEAIATAPEFNDYLESFDPALLLQSQEQRSYEICFKASLPTNVGEGVSGTLEQGQQVRYQLPIPEDGITVRLCVQDGHIVFYASTVVPTPNEAYYDYKLECTECDACELFVDPESVDGQPTVEPLNRRKRLTNESTANNTVYTNFTLYISIEGMEVNNTFVLESDIGDTTTPDSTEDDSIHFYIIYIISGSIGVLIVVVILSVVLYLGVKKAHGKNRVTVLCERTHAFSH